MHHYISNLNKFHFYKSNIKMKHTLMHQKVSFNIIIYIILKRSILHVWFVWYTVMLICLYFHLCNI